MPVRLSHAYDHIWGGGREHERKGGWLEKKDYCGKIVDLDRKS